MVVAKTLREYPNLELVSLPSSIAKMGENGLSATQVQAAMQKMNEVNDGKSEFVQRLLNWKSRGLSDANNLLVRRFDPDGKEDTIGFFVAKFTKRKWIIYQFVTGTGTVNITTVNITHSYS